jgi:hypothetical protein
MKENCLLAAGPSGSDPSSCPRRLVRTPVAVHLLPWEKENTVLTRAGALKTSFSLSEGSPPSNIHANQQPDTKTVTSGWRTGIRDSGYGIREQIQGTGSALTSGE